jgi:hypothetical protein
MTLSSVFRVARETSSNGSGSAMYAGFHSAPQHGGTISETNSLQFTQSRRLSSCPHGRCSSTA